MVIPAYNSPMARKPRLHVPGGLYHVMLRGNGGQDIFFDDEDRYHLYLLIQQGGRTIWPSGPRFLLHDEPHTLGYPGRGKSFVWDNAESVIPLHPLDEQQTDPKGPFIPRPIQGLLFFLYSRLDETKKAINNTAHATPPRLKITPPITAANQASPSVSERRRHAR
jgi:hypothetical protein